MLHRVTWVRGTTVRATDGNVGKIDDLYFDEERWTIRYVVVDTGAWLTGRHVLISPMSCARDWSPAELQVSLTQEQVQDSPEIESQAPVSREDEARILQHYGYPEYWGGAGLWGPYGEPAALATGARSGSAAAGSQGRGGVQQLRSTRTVTGFHLQATDGDIGHIDDFLIDQDSWRIRYVVVDTSNWIGGKWVVITPQSLRGIDWETAKLRVDLTRDELKQSRSFDSISELPPAEEGPPFAFI